MRIKKMSEISKTTQSSESDTGFIQNITIDSVFLASICSQNETPAVELHMHRD